MKKIILALALLFKKDKTATLSRLSDSVTDQFAKQAKALQQINVVMGKVRDLNELKKERLKDKIAKLNAQNLHFGDQRVANEKMIIKLEQFAPTLDDWKI